MLAPSFPHSRAARPAVRLQAESGEPSADFQRWASLACKLAGSPLAVVATGCSDGLRLDAIAGSGSRDDLLLALRALVDAGSLVLPVPPFVALTAFRPDESHPHHGRAILGIPIRSSRGSVVGWLAALDEPQREWTEATAGALEDLAAALATEIDLRADVEALRSDVADQDDDGVAGISWRVDPESGQYLFVSRRAEAALQESESRFRQLVEQSLVGTYIIQHDRFTYVNPRMEAIFGLSRDEILGCDSAFELLHEQDRPRAAEMARLWMTEETQGTTFSCRGRHRDGRVIHVEIHGARTEIRGEPAIIGTLLDTTERRWAEEELRRSEERFELATRATSDLIWDWDLSTNQVLWTKMAFSAFHYDQDDVSSTFAWWTDRVHPDDREAVLESIQTVLQQGEQYWASEYRFRRGDDTYATVLNRGYVVRTEEGEPIRVIGAMADFTERKQLEDQLRGSQRMEAIGRLAGGVAHDFNNLLMVILGSTDLLLLDVDEANRIYSDLHEIRKAAKRASVLTRQLLALGRRQVLRPKVIDPNEAIAHMEGMLRSMLGEDVHLITQLDREIGRVKIDVGQLEQAILNLAVNARDAMPQGGRVLVQTRSVRLTRRDAARLGYRVEPGKYVRVTVRDTGSGIDPEAQLHIFEPFFTTKEKGSGLGLSTVYGFVKQSGGYIAVESELGKGTAIHIDFPETREALAQPRLPVAKALPRGSGTILLVEDEDAVRSVARRILKRWGYTVLEAPGGAEALRVYERGHSEIDLLITDVVMPGMSGRELADHLTAAHPSMKVLFMSGHTDDRVLQHGIESREVAFVQKPFPPDVLLHRVQEILRGDGATVAATAEDE